MVEFSSIAVAEDHGDLNGKGDWMTDWRSGSAFFFPSIQENKGAWLERMVQIAGLPSFGLDQLPGGDARIRTRWVDMIAEARVVDGSSHRLLVISYLSGEFIDYIDRSHWWARFCHEFVRACEALSPIAAFVLSLPSTDLPDTILDYEFAVATGDGALLRRQDFALLYLSPPLDLQALDQFPELLTEGRSLDGGGRIAIGSDVPSFPDDK